MKLIYRSLLRSRGFALGELMFVIFIIAFLGMMGMKLVNNAPYTLTRNSKDTSVCLSNMAQAELVLSLSSVTTDVSRVRLLDEVQRFKMAIVNRTCPSGGEYSISNKKIECSIHTVKAKTETKKEAVNER